MYAGSLLCPTLQIFKTNVRQTTDTPLMCKASFLPVSLKRDGTILYIEADLLLDCMNVADDSSRMFTPVLGDATHRMEFPFFLVAGKRRYWSLLLALWGSGVISCAIIKYITFLKQCTYTKITTRL